MSRTRHARYHPSPDLEPYVEHYWSVQWDFRGVPPERVEVLSHPSIHLVFEAQTGARITGVPRKKFSRLLTGAGRVFAVKFTPGGFQPFSGDSVSRLTDTSVSIEEVFGDEGLSLARAIVAKRTDAQRILLVEEFLRRHTPAPDETALRIAQMVYSVAEDRGILRVEDLTARYGVNARTLQRLFAKYVGVSPKWVIQRYRLHEAAEQLASGAAVNQVELAMTLGYSDQAHFVRDFKDMVGTPPGAYAKRQT